MIYLCFCQYTIEFHLLFHFLQWFFLYNFPLHNHQYLVSMQQQEVWAQAKFLWPMVLVFKDTYYRNQTVRYIQSESYQGIYKDLTCRAHHSSMRGLLLRKEANENCYQQLYTYLRLQQLSFPKLMSEVGNLLSIIFHLCSWIALLSKHCLFDDMAE